MLEEVVIPNAKQDISSLFREEVREAEVQAVFDEYREKLVYYYNEVNQLTALKGKADNKLSMETWMDICRGYLHFAKRKGRSTWRSRDRRRRGRRPRRGRLCRRLHCLRERTSPATSGARRSSRAAFDPRGQVAFLNSQSLEQMAAGEASDNDAMATLDFDEFIECLAAARATSTARSS